MRRKARIVNLNEDLKINRYMVTVLVIARVIHAISKISTLGYLDKSSRPCQMHMPSCDTDLL